MVFRRKLTSLMVVALMVTMGVVASTHTHVHESSNGLGEVHVGTCAGTDCCGHADDHQENSSQDSSDPIEKGHEDCQVCQLLADFHTTTVSCFDFIVEPVVSDKFFLLDSSVGHQFSRRASVRGPPA
jgi:hypothetical protein